MGGTSYSVSRSFSNRVEANTFHNTVEENFVQNVKRVAHDLMKSQGIVLRESRDSDVHPNSFPIIIALDLTGSMQMIPQNLIKTGLPKMISEAIQGGVQSPAVLFLGVGDHEVDDAPLQVSQFESGDEELDLWLGRTYLEGGGGSNEGESYGLAHYFAAHHCVTDAWQKRGTKGLLITIGDEPSLKSYPTRAIKEVMGTAAMQAVGFTDQEALEQAQKQWEVYHINPRDDGGESRNKWRDARGYWKQLLGQNYIGTDNYENIPGIMTDLIIKHGVAAGNFAGDPVNPTTTNDIHDGTVLPTEEIL